MEENTTPDDLLTAGEAATYLAKKWGRPEGYSTVAFRHLRHRWKLEPALLVGNASLWRRADLDKIPEPSRSNPRPRRRRDVVGQKNDEESPEAEGFPFIDIQAELYALN